jgi:hypothetical protein
MTYEHCQVKNKIINDIFIKKYCNIKKYELIEIFL